MSVFLYKWYPWRALKIGKKMVKSISPLTRVCRELGMKKQEEKGRNPRVLEQESLLNESSKKKKKVKWVHYL